MGFDFLPHEHQSTADHGTAREEPTITLPRNEQDDLLGRDAARKMTNAWTMSSRLPEGGNLEVQRPFILDQLHSWEALMMEGSNSRVSRRSRWIWNVYTDSIVSCYSQMPETQSIRPPTFSIPVFRWFGNTVCHASSQSYNH